MLNYLIQLATDVSGTLQTGDSPVEPVLNELTNWLWKRYRLSLSKEQLSSVITLRDLSQTASRTLSKDGKLLGIVYAEVCYILCHMADKDRRLIPTALMEEVVCHLMDTDYLLRLPDDLPKSLHSVSRVFLRSVMARYFYPDQNLSDVAFEELLDQYPLTEDIPDQPGRWPNRLWILELEATTEVYATLKHTYTHRSTRRGSCLVREDGEGALLGEPIRFFRFEIDGNKKEDNLMTLGCLITNDRAPLTYDQRFRDDNNEWYTNTVTESPFRIKHLYVGDSNYKSSLASIGLFSVSFSRRYALRQI